MDTLRVCRIGDAAAFGALCEYFAQTHANPRLNRFTADGPETVLRSDAGGIKVFWLYEGEGEVFLAKGFRTKEGDGQLLPKEYEAEEVSPAFAEQLGFIERCLTEVFEEARPPLLSILSRRRNGSYIGDCANDLWKLDHTPGAWSDNQELVDAVRFLFSAYRDQGYSVKTTASYERITEGDQLIAAGREELRVRGHFSCLTLESLERSASPVPRVMRLRYLRDSSGGCNFDFDPFRRLPMTWYLNLPDEEGDGVNFANSHVVNIARETSPTHFHPRRAIGGGAPQNEIYLVLHPETYGLKTYGRNASIVVYPDLHDLHRYEENRLEPGALVYIPAGMGHRGLDVFVNVITIPGFKPHNEYYIDTEILDAAHSKSPFNENLLHIKNYNHLDDLI